MGIERNMDFKPMFDDLGQQVGQQLQAGVQGAQDIEIKARLKFTDVDMPAGVALPSPNGGAGFLDPAHQLAADTVAMGKRWEHTNPFVPQGMYPDLARVHEQDRAARASGYWGGIRQNGFLHSMQEVQGGKFDPWMEYLQGGDRDEANEVSRAARRTGGHLITENAQGMKEAGKHISELMKTVDEAGKGTPKAAKASEEIERLIRLVARLGEAAKGAADEIGGSAGQAAKAELGKLEADATGGMIPAGTPGGGGFKLSPGELRMLAENPVSGGLAMAQSALWQKAAAAIGAKTLFGSEGAFSAMGGGVTAGAATAVAGAAALYGGFSVPEWLADSQISGWDHDKENLFADYRSSSLLGGKFDIRKTLGGEKNRKNLDPDRAWIDRDAVRRAAQAMGVSFAGAKDWDGTSVGAGNDLADSEFMNFLDTGVSRRNKEIGVADGTLESIMGQQIKSGSVSRDLPEMNMNIASLVGLTKENNKVGISGQESLHTLVTMNQKVESQNGFVSQETGKYLMGLERLLADTRDPSLRGGSGASAVMGISDKASMEMKAGLYSQFLNNPQAMEKSYDMAFGDGSLKKAFLAAKGDLGLLAQNVVNDPIAKLAFAQHQLQNGARGWDSRIALGYLGLNGGTHQELMAMDALKNGANPMDIAKGLWKEGKLGKDPESRAQDVEMMGNVAAKMGNLANSVDLVQKSMVALSTFIDLKVSQSVAKAEMKHIFSNNVDTRGEYERKHPNYNPAGHQR